MTKAPIVLPRRYAGIARLRDVLDQRVVRALAPGMTILDVGAGQRPTVPPNSRPRGSFYVGLDVDEGELLAAESGSYDESLARDVTVWIPRFANRFDLIVSCYAFEHVKPLPAALENLRRFLRPGGSLIALFSGAFSAHAIANRLLPERMAARLTGRPPETKFRAHYDRCWHNALRNDLSAWSRAEITALYLGASYFDFSPRLKPAYLAYESFIAKRHLRNLASHYIIDATR